jgi:hypothetical protein
VSVTREREHDFFTGSTRGRRQTRGNICMNRTSLACSTNSWLRRCTGLWMTLGSPLDCLQSHCWDLIEPLRNEDLIDRRLVEIARRGRSRA